MSPSPGYGASQFLSGPDPRAEVAPAAPNHEAAPRPWIFRLWAIYFFAANVGAVALLAFDLPLAATALFFSPAPWFALQVTRSSSRGFGSAVNRFNTPRREVWLTIDDGPSPDTTPAILDLLDVHNAPATFFLIGRKAQQHPHLVAEIVRRGHTVGNHTFTHPCWYFWIIPEKKLAAEIDLCAATLKEAGAPPTPWFRPPVGLKCISLHRQLARRNLNLILWNVRGFDGVDRNFKTVLARIRRRLRPGAIILLHEAIKGSSNVSLIQSVLQQLDADGYRCVLPAVECLDR